MFPLTEILNGEKKGEVWSGMMTLGPMQHRMWGFLFKVHTLAFHYLHHGAEN